MYREKYISVVRLDEVIHCNKKSMEVSTKEIGKGSPLLLVNRRSKMQKFNQKYIGINKKAEKYFYQE